MKKSVAILVILLLASSMLVSARSLTESQTKVVKFSTKSCRFGDNRCLGRTFQVCDGSIFVTKAKCLPSETCTIDSGCVPRIMYSYAKGSPKDFFSMRLLECKEGTFSCLGRFVKVCKNHIWMQEYCPKDYWCHPEKGCVSVKGHTRFQERELNMPFIPKFAYLHIR